MDSKIEAFLNDIKEIDTDKYIIVTELRKKVFEIHPHIIETFKYGGIMFMMPKEIGGIFVYKNHVSFEFSKGFSFKDKFNKLEGSGKLRRHLKFLSLKDMDDLDLEYYISQF